MNLFQVKYAMRFELLALILLAALGHFYRAALGPLTQHMLLHLALMSICAPLIAIILAQTLMAKIKRISLLVLNKHFLWSVTVGQFFLFWGWHTPRGMHAVMEANSGGLLMATTLAGAATLFWLAIIARSHSDPWPSAVALIVTGKLFCLLALLLVFSPRLLYPHGPHSTDIADQQLAGLVMITACPLTYVIAAIVVIARWFSRLAKTS